MTLSFRPVWFDSMGAKSSCVLVKTPDISIIIDPGIAIMQPNFPASEEKKVEWLIKGEKAIKNASREADVLVISHYHYDHYFPDDLEVYRADLLPALKGEGSNKLTPRHQRGGLRGFIEAQLKTGFSAPRGGPSPHYPYPPTEREGSGLWFLWLSSKY